MELAAIENYETQLKEIKGTIIDGVVDGSKYLESKFRIAWFLKEAYTDEEEGFHMKAHYDQPEAYENFFKNVATPTWHPIIYSSYGILNGFLKWSQMDFIRDKPEMCKVIKEIAIINANKGPSLTGTFTLNKNLNEGFEKYKEITLSQILVLQPQISIFCNTFYLYKELLGLTDENRVPLSIDSKRFEVWEKDGKLFLNVYHPANRSQKREIYVNQIVSAVEKWASKN